MTYSHPTRLLLALGFTAAATPALAADDAVLVGDSLHGAKLYADKCAACHGDDGRGGRTGIALTAADRLNLIRDDQLFEMITSGAGLKKKSGHQLKDELQFLDRWDVVAYVRTLHMTLADYFPTSGRYLSKVYTIDKYGLQRVEEATGKPLKGQDQSAAVFTFFDFEGEEGNLTYVSGEDHIRIDQLKKDKKAGYLVFLPMKHGEFDGLIGIAMDRAGVITRLAVHKSKKDAALLNKQLSRFEGMGKKGQKTMFKVSGGKPMRKLAKSVFPAYMRAMETVTMYDREERERTWADD